MEQKVFNSPHWPKRPVKVVINDEFITFHFPDEDDREFYYIPTLEWIKDVKERQGREDNWHYHMTTKVYFTSDMRRFINESLGIEDSGEKLSQDEWTERDERLKQKAAANGGWLSVGDILEGISQEDLSKM